jgi:hypothetical protein
LEDKRQAAPQDVQAFCQLVGVLGLTVNMGTKLVDEAEKLDLGLCCNPKIRDELATNEFVLSYDSE